MLESSLPSKAMDPMDFTDSGRMIPVRTLWAKASLPMCSSPSGSSTELIRFLTTPYRTALVNALLPMDFTDAGMLRVVSRLFMNASPGMELRPDPMVSDEISLPLNAAVPRDVTVSGMLRAVI